MQLHTLKRKTPNKRSIQVGRGGVRGKTSGKGTKGQNARAGRKKRPEMRDVIKRFPKLRGRGVSSLKSIQKDAKAINLSLIESVFGAVEVVRPKTLFAKGIIVKTGGKLPFVKILASGEITKKVTVEGCEVSLSAKEKIESVGGSVV